MSLAPRVDAQGGPSLTFIGPASYTPGDGDTYTLAVFHSGTDPISPTLATDFPAEVTVSWTCDATGTDTSCAAASGDGNLNQSGDSIAQNGLVTYTLNVDFDAAMTADPLSVTATLNGGTPEELSETVTSTRTPVVNLAVAVQPTTASNPIYVPGCAAGTGDAACTGSTQQLTVNVGNAGPSLAYGASLTIDWPTQVTGANWSCAPASACDPAQGSGDVATSVDVPVGSEVVTLTAALDYASAALTDLSLSAGITAAGETDANDDTDSVILAVQRRADIRVVKTADTTTVSPLGEFQYALEVSNLGPSDVGHGTDETGILLNDDFPTELNGAAGQCPENDASQPCWYYCPQSAGADVDPDNCPEGVSVVSGRGDINDLPFTLSAGTTSTVVTHVSASSTASGQIANTASVALPAASPVSERDPDTDNSDGAVVDVVIGSDFSVQKTDAATAAVPGTEHSYTITVSNDGFIGGQNIGLSDTFPLYDPANPGAGFEPGTLRWQCRAFDGACCNHNSANCGASEPTAPVFADLLDNHGVDLPARSRVEFTVTGTLDPRATGTLANTASITVPASINDTNLANNSATDADTQLSPRAELAISKRLASLAGDTAPFRLGYRIEASNQGPSFVEARVGDDLSDVLLDATTATWTCQVLNDPGNTRCIDASGSGALDARVALDPGATVGFDLTVDTTAIAAGEVTNTATVSAGADSASVTLVSGLSGEADLSISKTDNRASAVPGGPIDYVITVQNAGPDDAFGARVTDLFPAAVENLGWTCEATTPVPGDLTPLQRAGAAATGGDALAASADGRHVYVVGSASDSLFVFDRNNVPGRGFGEVAPLETEVQGVDDGQDPGSAVSGLGRPVDVALSPDGLHVYVLSRGDGDTQLPAIASFARVSDPASPDFGRLTFIGSATTGLPATVRRLAVTGGNLYVSGDQSIAVYARDPVSGLPRHDMDHSADVPADPGALAVAGDLLFVGSASGQRLVSFSILPAAGGDPAGRLALAGSLMDAALGGIRDLAPAPDAAQLYVLAGNAARLSLVDHASGLVLGFSYSAADMNNLPAGDPLSGAGAIAVAPDGEHLLGVSADQDTLYRFRRDPLSGGLGFEAARGAESGLDRPVDLVSSADGRHLLIAAGGTASPPLTVYARRAPEPLFAFIEAETGVSRLGAPNDVAVSPDGRHVYAVSLPDNSLAVFSRSARDGLSDDTLGQHLEYLTGYVEGQGGVSGLDRPRRVQVSPDGRNVFVTSEDADSLAVFSRDAETGLLSFRQSFSDGAGADGLLGAQGMAMDGAAQHLYVAGAFDAAIAIFRREADDSLSYQGRVVNGSDGVMGLTGIRDLVVSGDGRQVLGVSSVDDVLVVFDRDTDTTSAAYGGLRFVQRVADLGMRLMALAMPGSRGQAAGEHVYVVAQNADSVAVLRRVTDPASTAFGRVQPLALLTGADVAHLDGPRDVQISPDGQRVYVAAEFSSALLVFDRDLNATGSRFGLLTPVESRRDGVDGVEGLRNVRALAVSNDSLNVYGAGFGDGALASFIRGTGSSCNAGGSGDIDDRVDIGRGGTLVYRASGSLRPGASGSLENTASVTPPERFEDPAPANNSATDTTQLVPEGDISLTKTSGQVSVVAGETVSYEITVRNSGPSHLVHDPAQPLTLTDLLDDNPGLVPGSATWTCRAAGSGALSFLEVYQPGAGMAGISDLALVAGGAGGAPQPLLAGASVLDDAVVLFPRDVDGRLGTVRVIADGDSLDGTVVDALAGARALVASADGAFLYVASRVADSVTVLGLGDDGAGNLQVRLVQTLRGQIGLDQAVHLALSADGAHLYVAGANDDAIAVYARDPVTGSLSLVESEQNGVNDPLDSGATVAGLIDVEYLILSPDGEHLYALSASTGSIALFDRDPGSGALSWRRDYDGLDLGLDLTGIAAGVFDGQGRHLYLAQGPLDRILVLSRDDSSTGSHGELSLASSLAHTDPEGGGLLGVRRLALSGDGVHLYATGQRGDSVAWFVRDDADGGLRFGGQLSNDSAGVDGLGGATGLVFDAALDQLHVAGTLQGAIGQFQRRADSFCPASGSGELNALPFDIAANGEVTVTLEATVAGDFTGSLENTATVDAGGRDPEPGNNVATETNSTSVVADLAITKSDGLREFDGLAGARALAGDDAHLYVAGAADNAIGVFQRETDSGAADFGALGFVTALRGGDDGVLGLTGVADLLLSGDGAHLYAVSPVENTLIGLVRDPDDGALSPLEVQQNGILGVTGLSGAGALALSPDDAHVYTVGRFDNAVSGFARVDDPTAADHGRLDFIGMVQNGVAGVAGLGQPLALAVAPDGRHVYVLGAEADTLAVLDRNPAPGSAGFGSLSYRTHYTDQSGGVVGLTGVRDLALGADGSLLYVLGAENGTLARFQRDTFSGELSFLDFLQDGTGDTTGLRGATRLLLDAVGGSLYVAGGADASISRYAIDPTDGSLAFAGQIANGDPAPLTGGEVFGLDGVADLLLSSDAGHLYAVAPPVDTLSLFRRGPPLDFQGLLVDGQGGVPPGGGVTYTIVVENRGPSTVSSARVVDEFPPQFGAVSWVCTFSGGAQCPPAGSGNLDVEVQLPVDGRVTFQATGVVDASTSGRLVNTATVSGSGVSDPDTGNNSATDDDTVLSPTMDLVVSVDDGVTEATPGETLDYTVTAANLGPSYAAGMILRDTLPAALHDVAWTCSAEPAAGVLEAVGQQAMPLADYRDLLFSGDGRFGYAVGDDAGTGAVAVYRRDPLDGRLSQQQLLRQGEAGVIGIRGAADALLGADGRFLYVAGADADAVAVFQRDAVSGELVFLRRYQDGDPGVAGLGGVRRLIISPDGAHLYAVGAAEGALAVFAIGGDGSLTQTGVLRQGIDGVDGLNDVTDLAWSVDGEYLLAVAGANQSLAAFRRDAGGGGLTPVALVLDFQFPAPVLRGAVALEVVGTEVLVAARDGNLVARFEFGVATDGTAGFSLLGTLDGAGLGTTLTAPVDLRFVADRARLYIAAAEGLLLVSLLGEQPALVAEYPAASFPLLAGLQGLRPGPEAAQLYSLGSPGIGTWVRIRGSRCPTAGTGALGEQRVDIDAGGQLVYRLGGRLQPNASGTLAYTVSLDNPLPERELNPTDNQATDTDQLVPRPDLALSRTREPAAPVAGETLNYTLRVDNAGPSDALGARLLDSPPLFDADPAGLLAGSGAWTCQANPPLGTPVELAADADLDALWLGASGAWVYAASAARNAVLVYEVLADGGLAPATVLGNGDSLPGGVINGLDGVAALAASRDGRHLYAAGSGADSVVVLGREAPGATWTLVQVLSSGADGVFGLQGPQALAITPDEGFVYVASSVSNAIAVFARDAGTGRLGFVERVRDGFGTIVPESDVIRGVGDLHVDARGGDLYAVARDSGAISHFRIDGGSGVLDFQDVRRQGEAGIAGLNEVRALAAAPGDDHYYALGNDGLAHFRRRADGGLDFVAALTAIPEWQAPNTLVVDAAGSRAYLLDGAAIHVLARDWQDGSLQHRFRAPLAQATALAQDAAAGRLLVATGQALSGYPEQALSRCLVAGASADGVDTTLDLGASGWAELRFQARLHPRARGQLSSTGEILPGQGEDPAMADNSATDSVAIAVVADLGIDKTGPAQAVAGQTIDYQVTVSNAGPSAALGLGVDDLLPALLENARWTCQASGESSCPASGNGDVALGADLDVGDTLVVDIRAGLPASARDPLLNTAVLTPEAGATDPSPDDHEASAATEVVVGVDMAVQLLGPPAFDPAGGAALGYRVVVANTGSLTAAAVTVRFGVDATVTGTVPTGCVADGAGAWNCALGQMAIGETRELGFALTELPAAPASLTAGAEVGTGGDDVNPANDSANLATELQTGGDVAVSVDNGRMLVSPGDAVEYLYTVTNLGSQPVSGIQLNAPLAPELIDASWTCSADTGVSCTAPSSGDLADQLSLDSGQTVEYRLNATVDPTLDPDAGLTVNQTVTATVAVDDDINPANNSGADEDPLRPPPLIMRDGFESP